jgi:two-component system chemotaxis response regulator CheB
MAKRNIIVIGASAGGFAALKTLVSSLPPNLDASIFIVWHMGSDVKGILPEVLNKLNTIAVYSAKDKDPILPNRIYVAPPDRHLLVEQGRVRVTRGPKENRFRPAVDPLFRSAAYAYGNRVIGVILSGALDDGTAGLWQIKFDGGTTVVQDPNDAEVPSMPEHAIAEVQIDHCVPLAKLAELLVELSAQDVRESPDSARQEKSKIEIDIAAEASAIKNGFFKLGTLSPYACPECHGVLSKIIDGNLIRFRCHTGHAYSADSLMIALSEKIEDSLYSVVRGLEEDLLLLNDLGDHYADQNQPKVAAIYFKKAKEVEEKSKLLLTIVHNHEHLSKSKLLAEAKGYE